MRLSLKYIDFLGSPYKRDFFVLLMLFFIFTCKLFAQVETSTVTGRVTQLLTGEPLQNVNVVLLGTRFGAATDENGEFRISNVPSGLQTIEFSYVGFITQRFTQLIRPGIQINFDVQLTERVIMLEGIEIIADEYIPTPQHRVPDGHFITQTDIRKSGVRSFSELLRAHIPRAQIREEGADLYISLVRATSLTRRYYGHQNPLIVVDGMRIGTSPTALNTIIHPEDIASLHVLRGTSALTYGEEGRHGVILIETIKRPVEDGDLPSEVKYVIFVAIGILYWIFTL